MDNTTVDLDNLSVKEPDTQEHRPVEERECYLLEWYENTVIPPDEDDSEDDGEPHTVVFHWRLVFISKEARAEHIKHYLMINKNVIKYEVKDQDDYSLPGMRRGEYKSIPPGY